jgi:hypothetical protein
MKDSVKMRPTTCIPEIQNFFFPFFFLSSPFHETRAAGNKSKRKAAD